MILLQQLLRYPNCCQGKVMVGNGSIVYQIDKPIKKYRLDLFLQKEMRHHKIKSEKQK